MKIKQKRGEMFNSVVGLPSDSIVNALKFQLVKKYKGTRPNQITTSIELDGRVPVINKQG